MQQPNNKINNVRINSTIHNEAFEHNLTYLKLTIYSLSIKATKITISTFTNIFKVHNDETKHTNKR